MLRNIDLRLLKLQLGYLLIVLGGRCTQLALAWWTLEETNSVLIFTNMIACAITAEVLAKPLLGWIGDTYNKLLVLKINTTISFLASSTVAALAMAGYFNPWALGALMIINSAAVGVRDPLQASIIPLFASDEKVALALRTKSAFGSLAILLGPALASGIIYGAGVSLAIAFDVLAVSIALALTIRISTDHVHSNEKSTTLVIDLAKIYSGFKVVFRVKIEYYTALFAMLINFSLFPFFTILIPLYVRDIINYPVTYIGIVDSCFGLGILVCSYKGIPWISRWIPRDLCVSLGFALLGCNLVIVGTVGIPLILPIAFFFGGVGLMLINIPTSTVRLLATPTAYRNRIFATVSFLSAIASPVGSATVGPLIAHMGIAGTITLLGATVLFLSPLILLVPDFKVFMRSEDVQLNEAYARRYPEAFNV